MDLKEVGVQVLDVLQQNLDANGLSGRGRVQQIDWKRWRGDPDFGRFDLLLGADLLYASTIVKVRIFPTLSVRNTCRCSIAHSLRCHLQDAIKYCACCRILWRS